ncbi:uncharacterized protein LOC135814584 isoform X2 [Sycon ciliatum]|uniref:uncharacterized protein LOC135814584 isoform X2 n=1 Tax=Sycon ciliatum TaxID=27933 RepID=UPI0031F71457
MMFRDLLSLLSTVACVAISSDSAVAYTCPELCSCSESTSDVLPGSGAIRVHCSSRIPTFDDHTGSLVQALTITSNEVSTLSAGMFQSIPNLKHLSISGGNVEAIADEGVFGNLNLLQNVDLGQSAVQCHCTHSISFLHALSRRPGTSVSLACTREGTPQQLKTLTVEQIGCSSPSWRHRAEPDIVRAAVGDTVKIPCSAHGQPAVHTTWEHDGQPVRQREGVSLKNNHHLRIDNVQASDSGVYTCTAANPVSELSQSVRLIVLMEASSPGPFAGEITNVESEVDSAGTDNEVLTIHRIAGGVDALKNQLHAAFDRITELEAQLSTLNQQTPSPTPPVDMQFSITQEARIEELAAAAASKLVQPLTNRIAELAQHQESLREYVMSSAMAEEDDDESPLNMAEGQETSSMPDEPRTAGQTAGSAIETQLSNLELEVRRLSRAGLNARQSSEVRRLLQVVSNQAQGAERSVQNLTGRVATLERMSDSLTAGQQEELSRLVSTRLQPLTEAVSQVQQEVIEQEKETQQSFITVVQDLLSWSNELTSLRSTVNSVEERLNSTRPQVQMSETTPSNNAAASNEGLTVSQLAQVDGRILARIRSFQGQLTVIQRSSGSLNAKVNALAADLERHSLNQMKLNVSLLSKYDELKDESSLVQLLISDLNITGLQDTTTVQRNEVMQLIESQLMPIRVSVEQNRFNISNRGLSPSQLMEVQSIILGRIGPLFVQVNNVRNTARQATRQAESSSSSSRQLTLDLQEIASAVSALNITARAGDAMLERRLAILESRPPASLDTDDGGEDTDVDTTAVSSLQLQINTLQSEIDTVNTAISNIDFANFQQSTRDELSEIPNRISTAVEPLNQQISDLSSTLTMTAADIANKISDVENQISVINMQISQINSGADTPPQQTTTGIQLSVIRQQINTALEPIQAKLAQHEFNISGSGLNPEQSREVQSLLLARFGPLLLQMNNVRTSVRQANRQAHSSSTLSTQLQADLLVATRALASLSTTVNSNDDAVRRRITAVELKIPAVVVDASDNSEDAGNGNEDTDNVNEVISSIDQQITMLWAQINSVSHKISDLNITELREATDMQYSSIIQQVDEVIIQQVDEALGPLRELVALNRFNISNNGLNPSQTAEVINLISQRSRPVLAQINGVRNTARQAVQQAGRSALLSTQAQSELRRVSSVLTTLNATQRTENAALRRRIMAVERRSPAGTSDTGDQDEGDITDVVDSELINGLQEQITSHRTQINSLSESLTSSSALALDQISQLDGRVRTLAREANELSVAEQNNVNELIRVSAAVAAGQIADLTTQLDSTKSQQQVLSRMLPMVQNRLGSLVTDFNTFQNTATTNFNDLGSRMSTVESEVATSNLAGPSEANGDGGAISSPALSVLQEQVRQLTTNLRSRNSAVDARIAMLSEQISNASMQLSPAQAQEVSIEVVTRLSSLLLSLNRLNTADSRLSQQIQRLQSQITAIRQQQVTSTSQVPATDSPSTQAGSIVDSAVLNELRSGIDDVSSQLSDLTTTVQERFLTVEMQQTNATNDVQSLAITVRNLRRQQSNDKSAIDSRLESLDTRLGETLLLGPAPVISRLNRLESDRDGLQQAERNLRTKITDVNTQLTSLSSTLSGVRRLFDRNRQDHSRRISTVESGLRTVSSRYRSAAQQLAGQASTMATVQSELEMLEEKLNKISMEVTEHHNGSTKHITSGEVTLLVVRGVQSVQRSLSGLLSNFRGLERRLSTVQTATSNSAEAVSNVRTDLDTVRTSLDTVQTGFRDQVSMLVNVSLVEEAQRLQAADDQRAAGIQEELEDMQQTIETKTRDQQDEFKRELANAKEELRQERTEALDVLSSETQCRGVAKLNVIKPLPSYELAELNENTGYGQEIFTHSFAQYKQTANTTLELYLSATVVVGANSKLQLLINRSPCQPAVSGLVSSIRTRRPVGVLLTGFCSVPTPLSGIHAISLYAMPSGSSTGNIRVSEVQLTAKEFC